MSGRRTSEQKRAFTLIELLVVISIVVLLVALLLPALHGARRQSQTVACQANLHQWAMIFQLYTGEHEGRWFLVDNGSRSVDWWRMLEPYYDPRGYRKTDESKSREGIHGILRCPAKTFFAEMGYRSPSLNYALNDWVNDIRPPALAPPSADRRLWRRVDAARSPGTIPLFLDADIGGGGYAFPDSGDPPPVCDGEFKGPMAYFCVPRHGSFVNSVFMDWSVRKVGLKELWTLKWHREYNTAGPWTKAGGALPRDWPEWMRKFKDY
ncbi:MAG: prepilin-type N-terminal cleavage/methylation domain-containing protein [Phycisphaerales bacterium]|nr:MAG: prepilin-type N-terminal cleavage/methylation domain-containing protein [Phycisphaerales bacterium]